MAVTLERRAMLGFQESLRIEVIDHRFLNGKPHGGICKYNLHMARMGYPEMYRVQAGDWIVAVNGITTVDGMMEQIRRPDGDLLIVIFRRPYPVSYLHEELL